MSNKLQLKQRIRQARGLEPADLVLKNCRIINVFCGEIITGDIAICGEWIAGIGTYSGKQELDCTKRYVCPGFMDGHIHIESSMLTPKRFVDTVLPHGTTAVICDPHEIANVAGLEGIRYLLDESADLPCAIFVMAPSCVPATHLEHSGATLSARDLEELLTWPGVIGMAEMMNFPGVLAGAETVMDKLALAAQAGSLVDGHAPGLGGRDLQAYIGCGIRSDHECTTAAEAREKLAAGMYLFIREGSTAKNLENLLEVVNEQTSRRCLLVTDDCHPEELLHAGHLDRILRRAIALGLDPLLAIQMVTCNVAEYFRLRNRGAVAPGYRADLVILDDLDDVQVWKVLTGGRLHAPGSSAGRAEPEKRASQWQRIFRSVRIGDADISFAVPARGTTGRVIRIRQHELITDSVTLPLKIEHGLVIADTERDIIKIAVVERHQGLGNVGIGFVQGFGLQQGALASTVGHDSHNIMVIGAQDSDMTVAVQALVQQQGGLVAVRDGSILARLVLDVAGLMSSQPAEKTAADFSRLLAAAASLGVRIEDPFMVMSFLALPVIPHLKITDQGLIDVDGFHHVDLFVANSP